MIIIFHCLDDNRAYYISDSLEYQKDFELKIIKELTVTHTLPISITKRKSEHDSNN